MIDVKTLSDTRLLHFIKVDDRRLEHFKHLAEQELLRRLRELRIAASVKCSCCKPERNGAGSEYNTKDCYFWGQGVEG